MPVGSLAKRLKSTVGGAATLEGTEEATEAQPPLEMGTVDCRTTGTAPRIRSTGEGERPLAREQLEAP